MAFLPQVYPVGFASAATTVSVTPSVKLSGSYLYVYVIVPTMTVGYSTASTPIWIQGSIDGTNFSRFTNTEFTTNTLVAGINDFVIASSVSQRCIQIPNFAMPYMRLEVSGTVTNPTGQTLATSGLFQIVCVSNQ